MKITIQETKKVSPPITLTLELSGIEAKALRTLLRNVGGSMNGPRGMTNDIGTALADAGVGFYDNATEGSVHFKHNGWKGLA